MSEKVINEKGIIEKEINENINEKEINDKNYVNEKEINDKNVNEKEINIKEIGKKEINKIKINEKEINKKEINEKEINKNDINKNEINEKAAGDKNFNKEEIDEKEIYRKELINKDISKKKSNEIYNTEKEEKREKEKNENNNNNNKKKSSTGIILNTFNLKKPLKLQTELEKNNKSKMKLIDLKSSSEEEEEKDDFFNKNNSLAGKKNFLDFKEEFTRRRAESDKKYIHTERSSEVLSISQLQSNKINFITPQNKSNKTFGFNNKLHKSFLHKKVNSDSEIGKLIQEKNIIKNTWKQKDYIISQLEKIVGKNKVKEILDFEYKNLEGKALENEIKILLNEKNLNCIQLFLFLLQAENSKNY